MTTLYDAYGRPVKVDRLREEIAAPSITSVRQVWYDSVANGLTPEKLAGIFLQLEQNDLEAYLTLAGEMERRDLHYHSVLSTRKLAIQGLDVAVDAATDGAEDVKIADAVREDIVGWDAFTKMLPRSLDALGKGFSVVEIMWDKSGKWWFPERYEWRDQRTFRYSEQNGTELRLLDEADPANGILLDPFKFIYHLPEITSGLPAQGGLARLVAVAFMCKGWTVTDWMSFMEIFGIPYRVGRYDEGESESGKTSLKRAVASLGADAAAILPRNMDIDLVETTKTAGAEKLFEGAVDWFDRQVSKGVLGQTMTTDDGSSLSQSQVHDKVRRDILVSDAFQLSSTLRRDLVKAYVDLNFGARDRKLYPKLRLVTDTPEDLVALSKSLPPFINQGLRIEASWIRDKFNAPEPEEGAEILQPEPVAAGIKLDEAEPSEELEEPDELEDVEQKLARAVLAGQELTEDQRRLLLTAVLAQRQESDRDAVDEIVDGQLDAWREVIDPFLEPVLELAQASASYNEFLSRLRTALAEVDADKLIKSLAAGSMMGRGLGDVTDET